MLSMSYLASSSSNVTLPNDHGLTGILLASELNLICLVSSTPLITSALPDQVQGRVGDLPSAGVEAEEGGGNTTRLPVLQGSGGNWIFQSATGQGFFHKAEVQLWERRGAGFRADSAARCYS